MASKKKGDHKDDPLSEKWHTLKQACKILDISVSGSKNYRKAGKNPLIVSKRFGKLYVNEYHLQKFLRDGLPAIVSLLLMLGGSNDAFDFLFT